MKRDVRAQLWATAIALCLFAFVAGAAGNRARISGGSVNVIPDFLAVGPQGISTDGGIILVNSNLTLATADRCIIGPSGDTLCGDNGGFYVGNTGSRRIQCASGAGCDLGTNARRFGNVFANYYEAVALSGNNALGVMSNGARVDFGGGASDYATSDGTIVTFAGPLASASTASATSYTGTGTTGTPASGTGITASATSQIKTWVHKVTVINTALAAAATTDVTLHVTPVNTRIVRVIAEVNTVFTGGALSAMTITCGNSAGGNQYLLSNSVLAAKNCWGDVAAEMGAGLLSATTADFGTVAADIPAAITVQCRFTCTGANCSAATQGTVTFYVEGVTYP